MNLFTLPALSYLFLVSTLFGQSTMVGSSLAVTGEYSVAAGGKIRLGFDPALKATHITAGQLELRLPQYIVVYEIIAGDNSAALVIGRQRHPGEVFYRSIMVIQFDGEKASVTNCADHENLVEWKSREDCGVTTLRGIEGDVLTLEICYGRYANPPTPIDSQQVRWSISQDAALKTPAK